MNVEDRLRISGQRYRQRREAGLAGWAHDESYKRKIGTVLELVAKYRIPEDGRFLELGCGAGNVTIEMARRGFNAYGIDIVPEAIEWAKTKAEDAGVHASFHTGTVALLEPFQDEFFDVVFDGDCLWMVLGEERPACFRNVYRVLKPGGVFFAQSHIVDQTFRERHVVAPGAYIDPVTLQSTVKDTPMYQYCREDAFLSEIQTAGFEVLHHRMGQLDDMDKDTPSFYKGVMFVEAGKPRRDHGQRTSAGDFAIRGAPEK